MEAWSAPTHPPKTCSSTHPGILSRMIPRDPCDFCTSSKSRWRTNISFVECIVKVQNGWLTLRNSVLALNFEFLKEINNNGEAAVSETPSTKETGNLEQKALKGFTTEPLVTSQTRPSPRFSRLHFRCTPTF